MNNNSLDMNQVTKLPALREVVNWFNGSVSKLHSNSYLSIAVYEITKYIHIFENYGIHAVDEVISAVADMLQKIWNDNSFIGHISDERRVHMVIF